MQEQGSSSVPVGRMLPAHKNRASRSGGLRQYMFLLDTRSARSFEEVCRVLGLAPSEFAELAVRAEVGRRLAAAVGAAVTVMIGGPA